MYQDTKNKKPRGGKREGAGRKPAPPELKRKPITVWLTPKELRTCLICGRTPQDGIRQILSTLARQL